MKSLDDPAYRTGNLVNFTRWSRENVPKPLHAIPLGAVVQYRVDDLEEGWPTGLVGTYTLYVTLLHHDCDGTALYGLASEAVRYPDGVAARIEYDQQCRHTFLGISEKWLVDTGRRVELQPYSD